jgi:uncharacterized RDD family membrane protein YckC
MDQQETTEIQPPQDAAPTETPGAEASLGQRIGAALIDVLIAMALSAVAGRINSSLPFIVSAAYMLTRDSLPFLGGQSIGKKALNLRAVTEGGKSLSGDWNAGLMRNITMAVPFIPLVELIIMLVNKDKPGGIRRLGDQLAKTKVVTVRP